MADTERLLSLAVVHNTFTFFVLLHDVCLLYAREQYGHHEKGEGKVEQECVDVVLGAVHLWVESRKVVHLKSAKN